MNSYRNLDFNAEYAEDFLNNFNSASSALRKTIQRVLEADRQEYILYKQRCLCVPRNPF